MATINETRNLAHVLHGFEIAIRSNEDIGFCSQFTAESIHLVEMMCSRLLDILSEYQQPDYEFTDFLLGWLFADAMMGVINPNHSFMNTLIDAHFISFGQMKIDVYQGWIGISV